MLCCVALGKLLPLSDKLKQPLMPKGPSLSTSIPPAQGRGGLDTQGDLGKVHSPECPTSLLCHTGRPGEVGLLGRGQKWKMCHPGQPSLGLCHHWKSRGARHSVV